MITKKMSFDEFENAELTLRAQCPKVFELSIPDKKATEESLAEVEKMIGIKLPSCYKKFLEGFGGGDYGLTNIFSADPESEWYLPSMLATAVEYLPEGLLPFSDDSMGGYYVVRVENRMASDPVYYWNDDGGLIETEFQDILSFIIRYAYHPA